MLNMSTFARTRFALTAAAGCAFAQGTVVAGGLNNPRGLAFGPDGALYVAEAGAGGSGPCGGPLPVCFGLTGSIARIDVQTGAPQRITTGLPSLAVFGVPGFPPGGAAIGPSDIAVFAGHGEAFVDIAFLPNGSLCVLEIFNGDIVRVASDGTRTVVAAGLVAPGGMTVGPDGALYGTNSGIFQGVGEVRRIVVP
jgi:hypothetical protein